MRKRKSVTVSNPIAWLPVFFYTWLLVLPTVSGLHLKTSGAIPCSKPDSRDSVNISTFSLFFNPLTQIVTYNVSGYSSHEQDIIARLQIIAYGKTVTDQLLDFCNIDVDELCPLPKGHVNITGTHHVPDVYTRSISKLAYTIPDLQAISYIQLYEDGAPDEQVGCFQTAVDNGQTAATNGAKWATLGLAGALIGMAAMSSMSSTSSTSGAHGAAAGASSGFNAPGFGDFFSALQGIAVTGMYTLDYPDIYRSFTQDMGWSVGMLTWSSMQNAVDSFRRRTGGDLAQSSYALLQNTTLLFRNSTLKNPEEAIPSDMIASLTETMTASSSTPPATTPTDSTSPITSTIWVDPPSPSSSTILTSQSSDSQVMQRLFARATSTKTTPTPSSSVLPGLEAQPRIRVVTGIQAYCEKLSIPYTNAFMTFLIWWVIIVASVVLFMMIMKLYLDFKFIAETKKDKTYVGKFPAYREKFHIFLFTMIVRLIMIFYGAFVLFTFYEFKIGDSWGPLLLAGVCFGFFTGLLVTLSTRITMLSRHAMIREGGLENLFSHEPWIRKYGVLYDQYQIKFWWFFIPTLIATFGRNAFLGAGNGNGLAQLIGQLVIDVAFCAMMIYYRPFNTKWGNGINIAIQSVRVISISILFAYVERAPTSQMAATKVGFVLLVIQSVLSIFLIVLILVGASLSLFQFIRGNSKNSPKKDDGFNGRVTMIQEKRPYGPNVDPFHDDTRDNSRLSNYGTGRDLIQVFSSNASEDNEDEHLLQSDYNGMTATEIENDKRRLRMIRSSLRDSDHESIQRATLSDVDSFSASIHHAVSSEEFGSTSDSMHSGMGPPSFTMQDRVSNSRGVFGGLRHVQSRTSSILVNEHMLDEPMSASIDSFSTRHDNPFRRDEVSSNPDSSVNRGHHIPQQPTGFI